MADTYEKFLTLQANAAYFKGLWKSQFLKEMTKANDIFYSSTSVYRHVDMMRQKGTFNHSTYKN